jgi:hypothetical protein
MPCPRVSVVEDAVGAGGGGGSARPGQEEVRSEAGRPVGCLHCQSLLTLAIGTRRDVFWNVRRRLVGNRAGEPPCRSAYWRSATGSRIVGAERESGGPEFPAASTSGEKGSRGVREVTRR